MFIANKYNMKFFLLSIVCHACIFSVFGWIGTFPSSNSLKVACNTNSIHRRNTHKRVLSMIIPVGGTERGRQKLPGAPPPPINELIRADRVRLIAPGNSTGEEVMLGIFPLAEAQQKAEEYGLDLVLINDKADIPVCKIIDYGKHKYYVEKKKKENLKKQVKVDIKEVKMSYKIDQHDFDVRLRAVQKFIGDGDRVRILIIQIFYMREYKIVLFIGKSCDSI